MFQKKPVCCYAGSGEQVESAMCSMLSLSARTFASVYIIADRRSSSTLPQLCLLIYTTIVSINRGCVAVRICRHFIVVSYTYDTHQFLLRVISPKLGLMAYTDPFVHIGFLSVRAFVCLTVHLHMLALYRNG